MSEEHDEVSSAPPVPEGTGSVPQDAGGSGDVPQDDGGAGSVPQGEGATDGSTAQRRAWLAPAPWWRLALAGLAVGGLVWGASVADGSWSLDAGRAGGQGGPDEGGPEGAGAFVEAAVLACPGPEPLSAEGASPTVEVLAAAAPQSVLDGTPPPRTADQDAAAVTQGPDAAAVTQGPDASAATGDSVGPDAAAVTQGPDAAAVTQGSDAAAVTQGPDAAAATGEGTAPTEGSSVLRVTDGSGPAVELGPGAPVGLTLTGPASALVQAQDELAPGVVGGQLGLGTDQGARGLTLAGCATPAEESWLVGGGDEPGRAEQLVLTNPGPDAVTVEVSVTGADGPVAATAGSGIVVPGHGRVVELLDALAPGAGAPVVRVTSTGGPVVAHLAEGYRDGTTDRGREIVSPGAAPATDVVVPALPTAHADRPHEVVLRLAAPGDSEAVVDLTALTADGTRRLPDQVTRVPAGSSLDVTLEDLPEDAVALRLRSDQPVVAGARLEVLPDQGEPTVLEGSPADGSGKDQDAGQAEPLRRPAGETAWVASARPSTTPLGMALPGRDLVPGGSTELALTAVDGTTAWVTWVDASGAPTATWVDLPNDTTTLLPVPEGVRAVWVVGAGPAGVVAALHVAGQDANGPYTASATLPRLPWEQRRSQVATVVP